jgi:hypothetical protein
MQAPARGRAARWLAVAALGGALGCAGAGLGGPPRALALPAIPAAASPERLVVISVHGLAPDEYLPLEGPARMPTLAALGAAGVAAESLEPVFPSATYPAHATLVTGLPPARHGVAADRHLGDRGVETQRPDQASEIAGATLWKAVTEAGGSVASLDWPATGGAAISDLLPDLDAARSGASWPALMAKGTAPRVAELARRAGADQPASWLPGPARDAVLGRVACDLLSADPPPRLLLLRFSETEAALEAAPPGSEQVRAAFASVDAGVGRLVECLRAKNRLATTAIAVVGDHGTLPVHTAIRANRVLADVGLVVLDPAGGLVRWDALARSNGGSAFVYARDADLAVLARRALEEAAQKTAAFRVISAEEMLQRGADPEAWFGLEASPGYVFADDLAPDLLGPATFAAAGGYASEQPRMATGFVAWGPGFRGPLRVPRMREIDVGPTLARLLGVELAGAEGAAMVGLLRNAPAPPVVAPVDAGKRRPRGS